MDAGLLTWEHRNHCPHCLWSRHVMFGCSFLPPCDGLMRPIRADGDPMLIQVCEDCGFRWVTYDEDWWAQLPPEQQTAVIDAAFAETRRQNRGPVLIFTPRAEYRTPQPAIRDKSLGTRERAARRP